MEQNSNVCPKPKNILGTEKVGKLLKMFAIPCVLSLVIQALYNIVDQIFIGNSGYLPFGNTATGIVYPLTVIALAIGLWIGDGTAASISINQGRNDTEKSHKSVGTGITVGVVVSLVLMVISFVFATPILQFFGARGEASIFLADAKEYSTWIIAGFPLFILACVINPIIRADGSPKFAMLAMATGAITNIVLDPIFIFGFKWGMTGAALATFIGQAITFIFHIAYLFKLKSIKLSKNSFIPDFKTFFGNIKLGVSSFLTQFSIVIISIVNNIVLSKYFVNTVQNAQGILNVAFKIFGIVISIAIGVAVGSQPILGYNYGAQKFDRVKETLKKVLSITLIVGLVATVIFEACPQLLLSMFGYSVNAGTSISEISFGVNAFRIYLGFIALTCLIKATSIFFQAIGKPANATLIAILRDVVVVVPLAIILPMLKTEAFMWSAPISDIVTMAVSIALIVVVVKKMPTVNKIDSVEKITLRNSKPGLIICISREHGAGGREIGKKLAEKLGVPFYDKEVTMLAAKQSGLASQFIKNIDKQNNAFYDLFLSCEVNQMAISAQDKTIKAIANKGACVIVGRAADYVLRNYDNVCKLFIYANDEYKIKRIMSNYGDDEKSAKDNLVKSDKRRANFYKAISGNEWANKSNYNLNIDSSIGVDASVDTILNYVKSFK